jgi:hypothetical protein
MFDKRELDKVPTDHSIKTYRGSGEKAPWILDHNATCR